MYCAMHAGRMAGLETDGLVMTTVFQHFNENICMWWTVRVNRKPQMDVLPVV